MNTNKPYFHQISDEEIKKLIEEQKNWKYISYNYLQPEWCKNPHVFDGAFGCWSLTDLTTTGPRTKITEEGCKDCPCFKPKEKQMKLDLETLIELEDYINHLNETVGLKPETVIDVMKAIGKLKDENKRVNKQQKPPKD